TDRASSGGEKPASFVDTFTQRVEQKSPITAVYLQRAKRVEKTENGVTIMMADATGLARLDTPEHKLALQSAAAELFGKPASLPLIIEGQGVPPRKEPPAQPAGAVDSARDEPLVRRFLEAFRGDIVQIKPANGEEK